jgi:hypothetical protein
MSWKALARILDDPLFEVLRYELGDHRHRDVLVGNNGHDMELRTVVTGKVDRGG